MHTMMKSLHAAKKQIMAVHKEDNKFIEPDKANIVFIKTQQK